jgi:hypothetical protein
MVIWVTQGLWGSKTQPLVLTWAFTQRAGTLALSGPDAGSSEYKDSLYWGSEFGTRQDSDHEEATERSFALTGSRPVTRYGACW